MAASASCQPPARRPSTLANPPLHLTAPKHRWRAPAPTLCTVAGPPRWPPCFRTMARRCVRRGWHTRRSRQACAASRQVRAAGECAPVRCGELWCAAAPAAMSPLGSIPRPASCPWQCMPPGAARGWASSASGPWASCAALQAAVHAQRTSWLRCCRSLPPAGWASRASKTTGELTALLADCCVGGCAPLLLLLLLRHDCPLHCPAYAAAAAAGTTLATWWGRMC